MTETKSLSPQELYMVLHHYIHCYDHPAMNTTPDMRGVCDKLVDRGFLYRMNAGPKNTYSCDNLGQYYVEHVLNRVEVPKRSAFKVVHDAWSNISRIGAS